MSNLSDLINSGKVKSTQWTSSVLITCNKYFSVISSDKDKVKCKCLICRKDTIKYYP